ncbi:MAG TPA: hypothetical protein VF167_19375 [Longimicrobiaceae bacterium]
MRSDVTIGRSAYRARAALVGILLLALPGCAAGVSGGSGGSRASGGRDARIGLRPGWQNAGEAISNLELIAHRPRPEGFRNPNDMGDFGYANTDIAFQGNFAFLGNYNGFQIWDISNPDDPQLRSAVVCPGGQGDLSVYGNLLFMSVEETRGRLDCGSQGVNEPVSRERMQGVRIFDISNLDSPRQVATVQTCRGSHTHTLVTDPNDTENVYIYVSGTSRVRPGAELAGCSGGSPDQDPNTAYFRIEVIRVPLDAPQNAQVVNMPRIFADPQTGEIAGLWQGGAHGQGTQETAQTNACHDITVYPEVGLAAGACSGNGILLDISDVDNPVRIDEVVDPNFAYWHSATFSNDADVVIYTDEWGGGMAPRCRASDRREWGADAIFTLNGRKLEHRSYYKLPAAQTETENCVAHNGSLIPVPGRNIMVQAWYQGGISVFDFTDPDNPVEIAYFDRGPMSEDELVLGGYWSAYWYNGAIYGSEIGRGLDVFRLAPSEHLTQNEIDAAMQVRMERFNPQHQTRYQVPASAAVARAYIDQLARRDDVPADRIAELRAEVDAAERLGEEERREVFTRLTASLAEEVAARGKLAAR